MVQVLIGMQVTLIIFPFARLLNNRDVFVLGCPMDQDISAMARK